MKTKTTSAPTESVLAALPFLHGLHLKQLQTLAECGMKSSFTKGEVVFREGDLANRFYVILRGSVALESQRKNGKPIRIQKLGPGDVLGWSWLFPPYRWHFDARALEPVTAIFFYGTRLREHCETDLELGRVLMMRMAEVMMKRLQATRRRLVKVSVPALRSPKPLLPALGCRMATRRCSTATCSKHSTQRRKEHYDSMA